MVTYDDGANLPENATPGFFSRVVFSAHHKTIGLQYLWLALGSVLVGMILSTLLRVHASWPTTAIPFLSSFSPTPERYAAMRLLHGSLMVFFVLTAAPQLGFGNYLLPLQIGAREMAFPSLNRLSFWLTFASLLGMTSLFFPPIKLWHQSVARQRFHIFAGRTAKRAQLHHHRYRSAHRGHDSSPLARHSLGVVH